MRFIIHELTYEVPVASGMWRYFHNERPTGAVEKWRLSDAADGYRFLRVDLDARAAESGRSYLYHLTLDQFGRPIQLKFRYWDLAFEIVGTVLLEEDTVIVTREIKGQRFEDVLPISGEYAFWYPASLGLGLLAGAATEKMIIGISLDTQSQSPETQMSPFITELKLKRGICKELNIMDDPRLACPLTISWPGHERTLWVDKDNWPLRMERPDGLSALETRLIHYQRISKPDT
jgi:hypothetical protein